MGNTNKRKGSQAEREIVQFFKELGFYHCKTSRQASRLLDDAGVDLWGIPFNVQVKAGYPSFNETKVTQYLKDRITELFPPTDPQHNYPAIVINIVNVGRGKKRLPEHTHIYMLSNDFDMAFPKSNIGQRYEQKLGQKRGWNMTDLLSYNDYVLYNRDKKYNKLESRFIVFKLETLKELIILNKEKWQL